VSRKKSLSKPKWMKDFRERMEFFEILEDVFEKSCDCHACGRLRKLAHRWEGLFTMPRMRRRRSEGYEELEE